LFRDRLFLFLCLEFLLFLFKLTLQFAIDLMSHVNGDSIIFYNTYIVRIQLQLEIQSLTLN